MPYYKINEIIHEFEMETQTYIVKQILDKLAQKKQFLVIHSFQKSFEFNKETLKTKITQPISVEILDYDNKYWSEKGIAPQHIIVEYV